MIFTVFTEIGTVGINHGGRVVEKAGGFALVHGHNHHHVVLLGVLGHAVSSRAGHSFGRGIPLLILTGAKIWSVKDFLQAKNLHALAAGFFNKRDVLGFHGLHDFCNRAFTFSHQRAHLDEAGFNNSGHDGRVES